MKEYGFYGWEAADVPALSTDYPGIRTPKDLYDKLMNIWCEYTCAPRLRKLWKPDVRMMGACSITSFLVQDLFGGKVLGIPREGGTVHCYNEVDGHVFDLTSEMFGDEKLCYENNPEQHREDHFAKTEKRLRYEYLCRALKRACGIGPDYQYVFFDLDGTLLQSEYGVIDSILHALDRFGVEVADRNELKKCIGPALFESFTNFFHFSPEKANLAVDIYRDHYRREGIYLSPLFDGVERMLHDLQQKGKTLLVITAKPQEMADIVLRHTGIDHYFQAVVGPDLSESRTDKPALLRKAFRILEESGCPQPDASRVVMVGDRFYDIEGAAMTGIDSIGVLYGYGNLRELSLAGASFLAGTPSEITEIICGSALPAQ